MDNLTWKIPDSKLKKVFIRPKIWNINQCVLKVAELSKGGNKEVPRWLQKCDLELKKRRETEVKMYKEMFGSDFKPEAWE